MAADKLSVKQLMAILDNVPAAVFVSAVDDRRLLYTNRLAQEVFPQTGNAGAACYTIGGLRKYARSAVLGR